MIRKGRQRKLSVLVSVLVSAGFRHVSPRIWSSTSMGRVMGCRARTTPQRQSNQQRSKPTKIRGGRCLERIPFIRYYSRPTSPRPREFYHDRLGLEILNENEDALTFGCGAGTQFSVTKSTVGTADSQTQVSWDVSDIRAEVAELRSRGVKVEDYDLPGLKTEDGIADIGFAWAAWIIDPGKNALGILQLKD